MRRERLREAQSSAEEEGLRAADLALGKSLSRVCRRSRLAMEHAGEGRRRGDGDGVLALTWLSTGLVQFSSPPGSTSDALGLLLLFSSVAMALTGVTALQSKVLLGVVFLVATTRFALGGLHQLTANEAWEDAAGIVGLVLFLLAIYAAFAGEIEDAQGRTVLPIGRRMKGRIALEGSLAEQLKHAPNEPGVRQQL